jgi:hypothetical protein
MGAFEYRQAEEIRDTFARHGVRYLFIGKSGAIILGFPDTTQDADIFPERTPANGRALVAGLQELGFSLTETEAAEIERGKDFVQLKNGPFDLDLVFAPDGIERFGCVESSRDRGGFPGLSSGRYHCQQGSGEPGEGSGVARPPAKLPGLLGRQAQALRSVAGRPG